MSDIKVNDRVRVVREYSTSESDYDGKYGTVTRLDVGDHYPYYVQCDGQDYSVWMHEVQPLEPATNGDRESLVFHAKSLLAGTEHTGADVIAMAAFLAG
ncbi:hypothetical protein OG912_32425 [Streptomyces sp. NBC_00464]|uniref:hypothetical protein n=1 Tax=Streptomyces sp. NBC_00464 TaxID=2975751 RepID=UPI002E17A22D